MDLRDRLKAMGVRPRTSGSTLPRAEDNGREGNGYAPLEDSVTPIQVRHTVSRKKLTLDQALPGSWHQTLEGDCFAVEKRYPVSQVRGPVALGAILSTRPSVLWEAGRAPAMRDLDARNLLFLDTETTG